MTTNLHSPKRVTALPPTWCPGCGNFGILGSIKAALDQLTVTPDQAVFVYDVGCSGNMADFVYAYGFHSLHGRALSSAAGIKLANHHLPVISVIGDGGCFGEGVDHFIGLSRGNDDITVLTHDNYLYSLTTGQKSPLTPKGTVTPSTPDGTIDEAFNPLGVAILNQATFVARGFAGDIPHLTKLLIAAISHSGFSLLDILQPCPTYKKDRSYAWYRDHIYYLDQEAGYQTNDRKLALQKTLETDRLPVGIFFEETKPAYHQQVISLKDTPLVSQTIDSINIGPALKEFI